MEVSDYGGSIYHRGIPQLCGDRASCSRDAFCITHNHRLGKLRELRAGLDTAIPIPKDPLQVGWLMLQITACTKQ